MSEFLAEARVLIRPDTTSFRGELTREIAAATRGVTAAIPITVAAAGGLSAAAATTAALAATQKETAATSLGLASAETVLNSRLAAQVPILRTATGSTAALSAAQIQGAAAAKTSTAALLGAGTATARLDAALLGLRTAVGSTAVIGLGAAALGAIALGKALRATVGIAAQTEQQFNIFRVTARATAVEMDRMAAAARQLGADASLPGVSSADAAQAMTELARAGLDVENSISAARGVLQLATAAQLDNAAATELAASALNAFGLAGEEATRVADLLAGAANAAQGGIDTMGIALSQAAAVARQVGLSIESTVTFLSLLAKNGLQGSDAGTSLRTALLRLINPTDKARAKIEELGIQIRDLSGAVRADVFAQFAEATENLAPAARDAALALIFGQDAIRAAAIIAREGRDGFDEMSESVTRTGQAAELAAARTQGFTGDVASLSSEAETAAENLGRGLLPILGALANTAELAISPINDAFAAVDQLLASRRPDNLTELANELGKAQKAAEKFGGIEEAPVGFRNNVIKLTEAIRDELGPALTATGINMDGYEVSLSDAAARSQDLAGATNELESAMQDAGTRAVLVAQQAAEAAQALAAAVTSARNVVAGLQEREDVLDIAGAAPEVRLQNLREQEEAQRKVVQAAKKNTEERRKALSDLRAIVNERRALEEQIANDVQADVRAADAARDKAYESLVAGFSSKVARQQNAVIVAEANEGLKDDLAAQRRLRGILERIIASGRLRAQDLANFVRQKILIDGEIARLEDQIAEARRAERQQQREDLRERLSLAVQIAEATGNTSREIRAREAEIKRIQEEIRQTRRNSLQRKRLILELRRAQKELRELKEERKKTTDEARNVAAEFFFSQLQAQQGFAANLLGNLITGSTAGLVGVPSPASQGPSGALVQAQRQADGKAATAPTSGQANTQVDILRKIYEQLRILNGSYDAPEAINQKKSSSGSMDIVVM